jgi:hypothetical protein
MPDNSRKSMYLKKFPEILNLKFSRILPNLAENKFRDREPRVEIVFFSLTVC